MLTVLAPSAAASPPAQRQYRLNLPSSGAGQDSNSPATDTSGSGGGSNVAVIVLAGGLVAIAGTGALVLWRRRQAQPGDTS